MLRKLLTYAAFAASIVALGCANEPAARECISGIVCPAPLQCAAVQPVCISNNCGNGIVDPGELCDDGNILDGDGCSHDCLSKEACGNGVTDPNEVCDDGNTANGNCGGSGGSACNTDADCGGSAGSCRPDKCSGDCKSLQTCGNNVTDFDEVCDDGGTANGKCADGTPCNNAADCTTGGCIPDGCSANCLSNETCGNGIVDLGEKCDNGSANAVGANCEPDCQGGSGCGNGIVDLGESCDDGNGSDGDDCVNCQLARCGDGFVDISGVNKEDCDPGAAGQTASCNANCTTPSCGDGIVNAAYKPDGTHAEQCDNGIGNNADTAACTANCQINVCGDGKQGPGEDCDNGASNGTSTTPGSCDLQCHKVACGNGVVDPGEQCDPRTVFTTPASPVDTAACDSDCTAVFCGDGHPNGPAGEVCDQGSANGTPCTYAAGPGVTCDRCALDCRSHNATQAAPYCGDGNTDVGHEVCDQGALNGTPCPYATSCARCNATCSALSTAAGPDCGDSVIQTAENEECDLSNLNGQTCATLGFASGALACSGTCQFNTGGCVAVCGNNVAEKGEECDGTALNGASCTTLGYSAGALSCTSCKFNTSACTSVCGNNKSETGEECDGTALNGQTCATLGFPDGGTLACTACAYDTSGCTKSSCGNNTVEGTEQCDGTDLNGQTCATLGFPDGGTLKCTACAYDTSSCTKSSCGNNHAEAGEQCDGTDLNGQTCATLGFPDGGTLKCTGCAYDTSSCTKAFCGNNHAEAGEQCDGTDLNGFTCAGLGYVGGTLGCSACSLDTTGCNNCGDGVVEPPETCDSTDRTVCGPTCQAPSCTDGAMDGDETGVDCGGTCPSSC